MPQTLDRVGDYRESLIGESDLRSWTRETWHQLPLIAGDEQTIVGLDDQSGGTPDASNPPQLVAIGNSWDATEAGKNNDNMATLARELNRVKTTLDNRVSALSAWRIAGTSAVSSCVTRYSKGGILLTTTTSTGDEVIITPASSREASINRRFDRMPRFTALIETQGSVEDLVIKAGLFQSTSTLAKSVDSDGVFFRYEHGADNNLLRACTSIGDTDADRSCGFVLAANTVYALTIDVDESRIPRFYITWAGGNGRIHTQVAEIADAGTWPSEFGALTAGDLSPDILPYIGIETLTDGAKALAVIEGPHAGSRMAA